MSEPYDRQPISKTLDVRGCIRPVFDAERKTDGVVWARRPKLLLDAKLDHIGIPSGATGRLRVSSSPPFQLSTQHEQTRMSRASSKLDPGLRNVQLDLYAAPNVIDSSLSSPVRSQFGLP